MTRPVTKLGSGARALGAAAALAAGVAVVSVGGPAVASPSRPAVAVPGPYHFAAPDGLATSHGALFVANGEGNSVTELSLSTRAVIHVLDAPRYRFAEPSSVRAYGSEIFVTNEKGSSVTVVDARTGDLVRVISGRRYGFSEPVSSVLSGGTLYVVGAGGSLTALSTTTGAPERVFPSRRYGLDDPVAAAVAGRDIFVLNEAARTGGAYPGSVDEIDLASGLLVRRMSGAAYGFDHPGGIAYSGGHLWVSESGANSLTEIDPSSGAVLHTIDNAWKPTPGFNAPVPVLASGSEVYVGSTGSVPMMTQVFTAHPKVGFWMCNSNGPFHFDVPAAMAVSGGVLWVANEANDSVTEMHGASGSYIANF